MKTFVNVLRLLAFLILCIAMYGSLFLLSNIAFEIFGFPGGLYGHGATALGCLLFAIFASAFYGGLSLLVGSLNPYPRLGMRLLLFAVFVVWLSSAYWMYERWKDYGAAANVYVTVGLFAVMLLYLSVKLYGKLDYERRIYV